MADVISMSSPPRDTPPVLSFPAILRNPGLTSRFAHLTGETERRSKPSKTTSASVKKHRRDQNDGKRWARRKDNAQFVGNPHIVSASRRDFAVAPPQVKATFPEPLPPYLPRTVKLPNNTPPPPTNPVSANAGRFHMSLKGVRGQLRRQGGRAEYLVVEVERAIMTWLVNGGTVLAPGGIDIVGPNAPMGEGEPIGNNTSIVEVSRTPLQLIWKITDDAFARYVVHCCARYHEIVSFSKGDDENRLTYLLRPNVTRPDRRAPMGLDTPPATDIDYSSNPDFDTDSNIDSDFVSDRDIDSDVEGRAPHNNLNLLDSISERNSTSPNSPELSPAHESDDSWSLIGDGEADVESSNEMEFVEQGIDSLAIDGGRANVEDPDKTMTISGTPIRPLHRPYPLSASRRMRAHSSPSRSPVRFRNVDRRPVTIEHQTKRTFYEFIFK